MACQLSAGCQELLEAQHGVIARWQLGGEDLGAAQARLRSGRWQPTYRGVYASFTGALPRDAVIWAAALRGGRGAVLSHHTAAELEHLTDQPSPAIHLTAGSARRVVIGANEAGPGLPRVIVHYSARVSQARHPVRMPPRTRVEETAVDLTQTAADLQAALPWLIAACSRRLTTGEKLLAVIDSRPRLRWRTEMSAALCDIGDGVHSALEWRYVRRVERAHGLPPGQRQAPTTTSRGQNRYFDNYYREFGAAVEVDGRVAHPAEARWRDIHRDNASVALGVVTLRYNWSDVTLHPCRVASEIASVLQRRGWNGAMRPCGPRCSAPLP